MTIFDRGTVTAPGGVPATPGTALTSTAPAATKASAVGIVHIMDGTTRHSRWSIEKTDEDWMMCALLAYPVLQADETSLPLIEIPIEHAAWEKPTGTIAFNGCTYTATEDFLASMRGRKLHASDREWLALHPWSKADGLGPNVMPMALHQMLEPYGMGISRLRLRQGTLVAPELRHWMDVLGCNPIGTFDASTSNAAFAAQAGMTEAMANDMFRFEFADVPIPGSIIGEKYVANGAGFQTGLGGGHARYLAPRASFGHWLISVTVAPLSECRYVTAPVGPEYVARTLPKRWDMSHTKRMDGCPVGVLVGRSYVVPEQVDAARASLPPAPPKPSYRTPYSKPHGAAPTNSTVRYPIKQYAPMGAVPEIGEYTHDGLRCEGKAVNPDGSVTLTLKGDHATDMLQTRTMIPQPAPPPVVDPVFFIGATTVDGHTIVGVKAAPYGRLELKLQDKWNKSTEFSRWVDATKPAAVAAPLTAEDFRQPGTTDTSAASRSADEVTRLDDSDGWEAQYGRLHDIRSLAPEVAAGAGIDDLEDLEEEMHELEQTYWPYSAAGCIECDCWLVESAQFVLVEGLKDSLRQLRWEHTALCIDCAMKHMSAVRCAACQVPLGGRSGDPTTRIDPREFYELPAVTDVTFEGFHLACPHCATQHAIVGPDELSRLPCISTTALDWLMELGIVGHPDAFEQAKQGVDMVTEYESLLAGGMP